MLCVDGRPAGAAFKGAADYLAVALAPQHDATRRALVQPQIVPEGALMDTDLSQFDCVFLCNVAQFTASEAQVLRAYLKRAVGWSSSWASRCWPKATTGSLPRPRPRRPACCRRCLDRPIAKDQYGLNPLGYAHPLVSVFRNQEQAGLLTTPVHKYFKLNDS